MRNAVTLAPMQTLEISKIKIGERRRKGAGQLAKLANSIERHGLVHPILVRNGNELVAGFRRLKACEKLGWKSIKVRHVDQLSDDELRAIEMDENTHRLALDDYEASKQRLREIQQAEAESTAQAKEVSARPGPKLSKRGRKGEGRPKKPGSQRDVSERTGISRSELQRIEKHVTLAEKYPFMQSGDWTKNDVLTTGKLLESMPGKDRNSTAALLQQPGILPKDALKITRNISEMESLEKKQIFELSASESRAKQREALALAAKLPPEPDPAFDVVMQIKQMYKRAIRTCEVKALTEKLQRLASQHESLCSEFIKTKGRRK